MSQFPKIPAEKLREADQHVGILYLLCAKTGKGEPFYAYISVKPSLFEEFCRKLAAHERMNLEEYGRILHKGFGEAPSEDVIQYMQERYGLEPDFAQKFEQLINEEVQSIRPPNRDPKAIHVFLSKKPNFKQAIKTLIDLNYEAVLHLENC